MLLELTHETSFRYDRPVSETYMEFRLTPLTDGSQHLIQHRHRVKPARPVRQYVDALGNTVTYFNLTTPLEQIEVAFDSVVHTYPVTFRGAGVPPAQRGTPLARMVVHDFLQPTPLTEGGEEFEAFILPFDGLRELPVQEAASVLRSAIYATFRYEGEVTNVWSTVSEVLRHGGGVCQDFAHLMLAACRHLGFPARYVSGYVLVEEAEATASHAWVEVFDPDQGWFGVDPTHNQETGERYVRLGIGRDYRDVPPNRGVYRGSSEEEVQVRVRLRPMDTAELESRARALYPEPRATTPRSRQVRKPAPVSILEQTTAAQQQQQ